MLAMGEVFSILIFFVVIILTALVFFGWVAFTIIRGLMNGVAGLFHPRSPTAVATNSIRCATPGCGAMNPSEARFCRRCGHSLPSAQQVQVRRAAVW